LVAGVAALGHGFGQCPDLAEAWQAIADLAHKGWVNLKEV
jgi:hypothetical protein